MASIPDVPLQHIFSFIPVITDPRYDGSICFNVNVSDIWFGENMMLNTIY